MRYTKDKLENMARDAATLLASGDYAGSLKLMKKLKPFAKNENLHSSMAFCYYALGNHRKAIEHGRIALEYGGHFKTMINLGSAYDGVGRHAEALDMYDVAYRIMENDKETTDADMALLWSNIAACHSTMGCEDFAEMDFKKALEYDPNHRAALVGLGMIRLKQTNCKDGWNGYMRRETIFEEGAIWPRWKGQPVRDGARFLIRMEQGFGDMFQFCRYAFAFASDNPKVKVIFHVSPAIEEIMWRWWRECRDANNLSDNLEIRSSTLNFHEDFDYWCLLCDLPAYKNVPDFDWSFPGATGTCRVDGAAPRIGLCWAGGKAYKMDPYRSAPVRVFEKALLARGYDFVSLQKGAREYEYQGYLNTYESVDCTGWADTAKLVRSCDYVISVDTAVAHLAGTLAVPTVLLLSNRSDWRWGAEGCRTFWYPQHTLVRMTRDMVGDWEEAFETAMQIIAKKEMAK